MSSTKMKFSSCILIFKVLILALSFLVINNQPTFSDNCAVWNVSYSICQQCNPGFYLQYFFCIPCNPNCACSSKNDFCQSCIILQYNGLNYYSYHHPKLDQCYLCNSSMPYCLECENLQICTKCFNGQVLVKEKDLDGLIITQYCGQNVCQSNCQICLNHAECQQCQPGFYLFLNKTCSSNPCGTNCTACSSLTQCSSCNQGYFLIGNQCSQCINNCSICNNGTGCQLCSPQFALQNGTCTNTSLSNCIEYANDFTMCTGCQQGYEVTAGSCNQCSGCNVCTEPFICLTPCLPGYSNFNFACISSYQSHTLFFGGSLIILILIFT